MGSTLILDVTSRFGAESGLYRQKPPEIVESTIGNVFRLRIVALEGDTQERGRGRLDFKAFYRPALKCYRFFTIFGLTNVQ